MSRPSHLPEAADVVIVGAGPAGLATAIRARQGGLSVVVVDSHRPPLDQACGEGLMPGGARELQALGVRLPEDGSRPFVGIRYLDAELVAEGRFPDGSGEGVRRTLLHAGLARRAEELGARLEWGVRATALCPVGISTDQGVLAARWVVGADGRDSRVRRWAGLEGRRPRHPRFGMRCHYRVQPWTDHVEVYWGLGCDAYVTPVGPDLVDVAFLGGAVGSGRFYERLQQFPRLADRLSGAATASGVRGAGPFGQRSRGVWRGNVALVGDASGCLDPITGEGVSLALHQARTLVEALLAGDLRRYARAHARQSRAPRRLNALVLAMGRRPRLRRLVVRTLSEEPRLFTRFLAAAGAGAPAMAGALALMAWPLVRSVVRS